MNTAVVDSSVVTDLLDPADHPDLVARFRSLVGDDPELRVPEHFHLEVMSALRRNERLGRLDPDLARSLVENLKQFPVDVVPTPPLLMEIWALRENLTTYDAAYVTVAAANDCPLLTRDRKLAKAPNLPAEVILV